MPKQHFIQMDMKGVDKTIKELQATQTQIQVKMKQILLRAAMILEAEIKKQITAMGLVDTGNLRASVHSFVRQKFNQKEGVAGTNVDYAPFLEYGTGQRGASSDHPDVPDDYLYGDNKGITAYKFMHKAWVKKRDDIITYVNTEVRKVIAS